MSSLCAFGARRADCCHPTNNLGLGARVGGLILHKLDKPRHMRLDECAHLLLVFRHRGLRGTSSSGSDAHTRVRKARFVSFAKVRRSTSHNDETRSRFNTRDGTPKDPQTAHPPSIKRARKPGGYVEGLANMANLESSQSRLQRIHNPVSKFAMKRIHRIHVSRTLHQLDTSRTYTKIQNRDADLI